MTTKALWAFAFLLAFLASTAYSQRTIRLNRDGTMKILFFSDIHFGEEKETDGTSHSKSSSSLQRLHSHFHRFSSDLANSNER